MMLKKSLRHSLLGLIVSLPGFSWAGGSMVGNGAGLVENNFQYAYQSLPRFIESCLESSICQAGPADRKLLQKISAAAQKNLVLENRLIFVSEKERPGFFTTGVGEENRIAKTSLEILKPIYINFDLLYANDGSANVDIPTMYSILTHELGHQVGIKQHAALDILGSKLKKFVLDNWQTVTLPLNADFGGDAEASIINHKVPYRSTDVLIQWHAQSKRISTNIIRDIGCKSNEGNFSGIQIYNAHFGINPEEKTIQFYAWADVYCFNPAENTVRLFRRSFGYDINSELKLNFLGLKNLTL